VKETVMLEGLRAKFGHIHNSQIFYALQELPCWFEKMPWDSYLGSEPNLIIIFQTLLLNSTMRNQVGSYDGVISVSGNTQCCLPIIISRIDFCIPNFNELFHNRDVAIADCIM